MRQFLILLFFPFSLLGQVNFTTSNLPIVVINTNSQTIMDDPRIVCDMCIIDNGFGTINSISDPFNDYNGKISIEYRGSSSQSFPKKSYALETQDSLGNNNNVSLLGMPVENDWILYAPYTDKSLMRNFLTFDLGRKMGHYAPRTVYCELVINGDYKGIYILMEKIKRDNNRLDIAKLDADDLAGDSLTGGYIIKVDKYTGTGGADWLSDFPKIGDGSLYIQYHYPEANVLLPQQLDYIEHFVDSFEYALAGPNFADTSIGYAKYIDVNSFIDLYIINELSRNIDGYRLSTYLHKDKQSRGGKLTMGPFWDFNLAFGNSENCSGGLTSGWEVNGGCGGNNPFWFERLLEDNNYHKKLKSRWEYLRDRSFHQDSLFNFIDSMALYLNDAQQRNFQQWPILGNYVWPNYYVGDTYQDELNFFKTWISSRLQWIDNNIACNYNSRPLWAASSNNSTSYDTLTACDNYIWNGTTYDSSGIHTFSTTNSIGCDSTATLNLTINPSTTKIIKIPKSDSYTWNRTTYPKDGVNTFVTTNANGCDSTVYLNFRIDSSINKTLLKITDLLGRETKGTKNEILFYIYNDGTVEKRIIIE